MTITIKKEMLCGVSRIIVEINDFKTALGNLDGSLILSKSIDDFDKRLAHRQLFGNLKYNNDGLFNWLYETVNFKADKFERDYKIKFPSLESSEADDKKWSDAIYELHELMRSEQFTINKPDQIYTYGQSNS